MEIKRILKSTAYLGTVQVVKFAIGLLRSKINAIFLGPAGVGITSQLQDSMQRISIFAVMSMNEGMVKQIAQNKNSDNFQNIFKQIVKTYFLIILVILFVLLVFLIIFLDKLTIFLFGNLELKKYMAFGVLSIPFLMFNTITYAVLKGFGQIKYIARSETIIIIANLLIYLPLVILFRLKGAIIFVFISFVLVAIIYAYFAHKNVLVKMSISIMDIAKAKFNPLLARELFYFAGIGLVAGNAEIISELFARSIVVNNLGVDKIGIYSVNITATMLFSGFVMPTVATYLGPRFAEIANDNKLINEILNSALRLFSFIMIPFLFFTISFRYQIISLLYSKQFIEAGQYLPWHLIGTFFYVWMMIFSQTFAPTGRVFVYGIFMTCFYLLNLLLVFYLTPVIGLYGWLMRFLISPFLFSLIFMIYLHKEIGFLLEFGNIRLFFYIIIVCLLLIYLPTNHVNYVASLVLCFSSFFLLSQSEKHLIYNFIFNTKKRQ